jgi:hypothetical protein
MDNFLFAFLVGIIGGELATRITKNNTKIEVHIPLIYMISFSTIYTIFVIFTGIVFLLRGFPIPWNGIGISSILISLTISAILLVIQRVKK